MACGNAYGGRNAARPAEPEKTWKQVDFIFSHDGPASDVAILGGGALTIDPLNQYLDKVKQEAVYKKWFFGHHHRNMPLTDKDSVIYDNIERIW